MTLVLSIKQNIQSRQQSKASGIWPSPPTSSMLQSTLASFRFGASTSTSASISASSSTTTQTTNTEMMPQPQVHQESNLLHLANLDAEHVEQDSNFVTKLDLVNVRNEELKEDVGVDPVNNFKTSVVIEGTHQPTVPSRQFEKELALSAETALGLLTACLGFDELKEQVLEAFASWLRLSNGISTSTLAFNPLVHAALSCLSSKQLPKAAVNVISELIYYSISGSPSSLSAHMPLIHIIVPRVMGLKEQLRDYSKEEKDMKAIARSIADMEDSYEELIVTGFDESMLIVPALLEVASHPDYDITSMTCNFWHHLQVNLIRRDSNSSFALDKLAILSGEACKEMLHSIIHGNSVGLNLLEYEIWLADVSIGSTKLIQSTKIIEDGFMIWDPGPYAWVQYVPGEPIPKSRPNRGSMQGRKWKKRIPQRKAFILSEKNKEMIEKKIAAVEREKAWAECLVEWDPGIQNFEEYQVCSISVDVVGDICRELEENVLPYCHGIMRNLLKDLSNPVLHRSVKPPMFSCFGDIALAIGEHFEKYIQYALPMLKTAVEHCVSLGASGEDILDDGNQLRLGIFEAYSGILQGFKSSKADLMLPQATHSFLQLWTCWCNGRKNNKLKLLRPSSLQHLGENMLAFY